MRKKGDLPHFFDVYNIEKTGNLGFSRTCRRILALLLDDYFSN